MVEVFDGIQAEIDLTGEKMCGLYCIFDKIGNCRYSAFFEYPNNYVAVRSFLRFLDTEFPIENCKDERTHKMNEMSRKCFVLKRVAVFKDMSVFNDENVDICNGEDAFELFERLSHESI